MDCFRNPEGYYLENEIYKNCYKSCKYCSSLGNDNDHKCVECYENYTSINDFDNINNCFEKCDFYYYYDNENNNKYQCTLDKNCPEKYNKIIENKSRCIDKCNKDKIYKYEYNNKCYKSCPEGTLLSLNISYLCQNIEELEKYKSIIYEKEINLTNNEISDYSINSLTKEYISHVGNMTNIVSKMENENLKIYIYRNITSLEETAGEAPKIDFGECYNKVKSHYDIKGDLLITLIKNETDRSIYGSASNKYAFCHPETGEVLNTTGICSEEDKIIIKENVRTLLENIDDKKKEYINYIIEQGIDIFNLSDRFYCDICYHFESPNNKDVPLKDRISSFFPNITLCDPGCENKGVDLEKMKVKC